MISQERSRKRKNTKMITETKEDLKIEKRKENILNTKTKTISKHSKRRVKKDNIIDLVNRRKSKRLNDKYYIIYIFV